MMTTPAPITVDVTRVDPSDPKSAPTPVPTRKMQSVGIAGVVLPFVGVAVALAIPSVSGSCQSEVTSALVDLGLGGLGVRTTEAVLTAACATELVDALKIGVFMLIQGVITFVLGYFRKNVVKAA